MSWDTCVAGLLALLFLASVLHQFEWRRWSWLSAWDPLSVLPRWSFFAPNPGQHDHHVAFRDLVGDEPMAWQALGERGAPSMWRWLWNPARFETKGVSDLTSLLLRSNATEAVQSTPRAIMLSNTYLALLSWAIAQPADSRATHRQFALIRTSGFGSDRVLAVDFVSFPHALVARESA